jgi:hypothetical protein
MSQDQTLSSRHHHVVVVVVVVVAAAASADDDVAPVIIIIIIIIISYYKIPVHEPGSKLAPQSPLAVSLFYVALIRLLS